MLGSYFCTTPKPVLLALTITATSIRLSLAFTNSVQELHQSRPIESRDGGIVRGPKNLKRLALVFTGHSYAEGAEPILGNLRSHHAKASFFLTGDFLTDTNFAMLVKRI